VAQARLPVFYQEFGVPDTLEGRFVVLSLNLFAVLHRLKGEDAQGKALSQDLADRFKDDMETVLRELGISDLRIPKKMRGLARSSAALLRAYEEAYGAPDQAHAEATPRPFRPAARRQRLSRRLCTSKGLRANVDGSLRRARCRHDQFSATAWQRAERSIP
jgi:cytochrome b pre-mRNA-processing protein 3